ncbi:MAG: hypothetical protein U0414_12050 [Polyangiaceae bacterium]
MLDRTTRCAQIRQDLARTLAGLRALDWDALGPRDPGASGLLGLGKLLDRAARAAEQLEQIYPRGDDLVVTAFFVRCAIDGLRQDLPSATEVPNLERVVDAVSSIEAGLSRVIEMFAQREGLRASLFGPSELVRALRNRRSIAELDRLLGARVGSHSPTERVRLVGTGLTKLIGSTAFNLLPIAPRRLLRTMRVRMHALLVDRAPSDELERALNDCGAAVAILFDTVNRELLPHDLEVISGALEFLKRGDVSSAESMLAALRPRCPTLAALLDARPVAAEPLRDVLVDLRERIAPPPREAAGEPFLDLDLEP